MELYSYIFIVFHILVDVCAGYISKCCARWADMKMTQLFHVLPSKQLYII